MDTLKEYCRILGIQDDPNRSREATVLLIRSKLPDFSPFDEILLEEGHVEDDTVAAEWLRNNRQSFPMQISFKVSVRVPVNVYYLANLTSNRGNASDRLQELLTDTETPRTSREAIIAMLNEGFSYNETAEALRKANYVLRQTMYGTGVVNHMVPALWVSAQPRTTRWYHFGLKQEVNDVTLSQPVLWHLPEERIDELGLPKMPVYLPVEMMEETSEGNYTSDAPTEPLNQVDTEPEP